MKRILKYTLAAFFALAAMSWASAAQDRPIGLTTICIDPGHGGHDPGCISRDGKKTMEKDIALAIGLKVRDLVNDSMPEMKVIMTRDDDTFVELGERAAIAKRGKAGLFLSIHVNSVDPKNNKNYASVNGFSIHTLGQSRTGADLFSANMNLCKRENSVILLEKDYSTKYQGFNPNDPESYIIFNLMQNANLSQSLEFAEDLGAQLSGGAVKKNRGISQDPLLVLWKTTMPAVLIECGFITSAQDLEAMRSEAGQDRIAKGIFRAISTFKKRYDGSVGTTSGAVETPQKDEKAEKSEKTEKAAPSVKAPADDDLKSGYGTQIMAIGRKLAPGDASFKGNPVRIVKSGNIYKYIAGFSTDLSKAREAKKKLEKDFPGCFLVEYDENGTKRVK